jgi:DNA replication initiation complex subunit (GINS family)
MGEEGLTAEEWTQTHFKERFNPGGSPSPLPKDFYPHAYVSLALAAKGAEGDPAKQEQLNRLHARFREILESRVGKVTRIATTETSPQPGVLQPEEQALYEELEHVIGEWRREMRRLSTR